MKREKLVGQVVLDYAVSLGAKEDEITEFFHELQEIGKQGFKEYLDYMKKTKIIIKIGEVTLNEIHANFIYKYTTGIKDLEDYFNFHSEINKEEYIKNGFALMDKIEEEL